jgi:hypothetical protein
MLLRFEGGACDGHEELSDSTPPHLVMVAGAHGYSTDGDLAELPDRLFAVYERVQMDQELGVAVYEPLG